MKVIKRAEMPDGTYIQLEDWKENYPTVLKEILMLIFTHHMKKHIMQCYMIYRELHKFQQRNLNILKKIFMEFIRITKRTKQKHGQMLQTETNGIGKLFRFNNRGFYGKRIVFKRVLPRMESN